MLKQITAKAAYFISFMIKKESNEKEKHWSPALTGINKGY